MLSGGTTAVAIDRVLAQYSDVPLHLDEFRQDEADKNRISSLRGPFNRQSKTKGKMDQTNKTRSVQPMTSPIVTGEGVTNDSATLSRYIEAILAADKRLGTKEEQGRRYQRMLSDSFQYHRIIRYVLLNRKWFGKTSIAALNEFIDSPDVVSQISSDRMRLSYGTAFCGFSTMMAHFMEAATAAQAAGTWGEFPMLKDDLLLLRERVEDLRNFTLAYAHNAAADVTAINFVVKYWSDVVTFLNINQSIKRFIWFEWCNIDPETSKVTRTNVNRDQDGVVRCIALGSTDGLNTSRNPANVGTNPSFPLTTSAQNVSRSAIGCPTPRPEPAAPTASPWVRTMARSTSGSCAGIAWTPPCKTSSRRNLRAAMTIRQKLCIAKATNERRNLPSQLLKSPG